MVLRRVAFAAFVLLLFAPPSDAQGNGCTATLNIPPDIPVNCSALQLDWRDDGVHGGSYVLKNNSRAGLVTLVTSWSFEGNDPAAAPHSIDVIDSWASDEAFRAAGAEAREKLDFVILPQAGETLERVIGTVIYAEFDDGTRLGPGVNTWGPKLRAQRTTMLSAYKDLLKLIRSGADPTAVATLLQTTPELAWLNGARGGEGVKGLVAEITKPRRLAP